MSQPLEAAIYFVWVCRPAGRLPPPKRTWGSTPHTHHAVLLPPPGATHEKLAEPSWPLRHPVTLTILGHLVYLSPPSCTVPYLQNTLCHTTCSRVLGSQVISSTSRKVRPQVSCSSCRQFMLHLA